MCYELRICIFFMGDYSISYAHQIMNVGFWFSSVLEKSNML